MHDPLDFDLPPPPEGLALGGPAPATAGGDPFSDWLDAAAVRSPEEMAAAEARLEARLALKSCPVPSAPMSRSAKRRQRRKRAVASATKKAGADPDGEPPPPPLLELKPLPEPRVERTGWGHKARQTVIEVAAPRRGVQR